MNITGRDLSEDQIREIIRRAHFQVESGAVVVFPLQSMRLEMNEVMARVFNVTTPQGRGMLVIHPRHDQGFILMGNNAFTVEMDLWRELRGLDITVRNIRKDVASKLGQIRAARGLLHLQVAPGVWSINPEPILAQGSNTPGVDWFELVEQT